MLQHLGIKTCVTSLKEVYDLLCCDRLLLVVVVIAAFAAEIIFRLLIRRDVILEPLVTSVMSCYCDFFEGGMVDAGLD